MWSLSPYFTSFSVDLSHKRMSHWANIGQAQKGHSIITYFDLFSVMSGSVHEFSSRLYPAGNKHEIGVQGFHHYRPGMRKNCVFVFLWRGQVPSSTCHESHECLVVYYVCSRFGLIWMRRACRPGWEFLGADLLEGYWFERVLLFLRSQ